MGSDRFLIDQRNTVFLLLPSHERQSVRVESLAGLRLAIGDDAAEDEQSARAHESNDPLIQLDENPGNDVGKNEIVRFAPEWLACSNRPDAKFNVRPGHVSAN